VTEHQTLAEAAREERTREAKAIVLFLQGRLDALEPFQRGFIGSLDPERVAQGALEWAEEIARGHGYQNAG
jgi:hypothetical protein